MKKNVINLFAIVGLVLSGIIVLNSFSTKTTPTNTSVEGGQFMIVTTVESIIPGGLGRSRMFVTSPNGALSEEVKLKNFYSMVGINMGNINENDASIVNKINEIQSQGWILEHVSTGVQSPAIDPNGGKGEGIYMTRYYFKK